MIRQFSARVNFSVHSVFSRSSNNSYVSSIYLNLIEQSTLLQPYPDTNVIFYVYVYHPIITSKKLNTSFFWKKLISTASINRVNILYQKHERLNMNLD